ncbi:SDR family NAD(P)-dependent oxidoreductase [Bradyrhizobium uaiense]|uniref:SDR family NAD(P)-dependent oxidoreductase n=1 Tax=Bradyrhizobium uaiense TaxID=2594946 RepID=A0A6P1BAR7_9BRAD|nr:SDR family NAD(P)-dependent oxidoreductase [Bradyrhizobium uaiense]
MVFGGARGIGGAIVKRLGEDGFDVAFTFVSQPDRAAEIVAAVEARGRRATALKADSADSKAIQHAVDFAADQLGPLDAVVVNAGVLRLGPIDTFPLEDLDLSLAVNVRGDAPHRRTSDPTACRGAR